MYRLLRKQNVVRKGVTTRPVVPHAWRGLLQEQSSWSRWKVSSEVLVLTRQTSEHYKTHDSDPAQSEVKNFKFVKMSSVFVFFPSNWNPLMMSLQCLWSDAIPSHFIHKSSHRKEVLAKTAESKHGARGFWTINCSRCDQGRANVHRKFDTVAFHHLQTATTCGQLDGRWLACEPLQRRVHFKKRITRASRSKKCSENHVAPASPIQT